VCGEPEGLLLKWATIRPGRRANKPAVTYSISRLSTGSHDVPSLALSRGLREVLPF
jgi:hypothetical protein